jgi:RNA polymerase sigma factor (sigma-70 family)
MNDMIAWIAAEAERPETGGDTEDRTSVDNVTRDPHGGGSSHPVSAKGAETRVGQPQDNSQSGVEDEATSQWPEPSSDYERERRTYRGRTVAMLRRYMRYSLETGRLPSLVGREFFRAKITKYRVTTFEDRVIFVHDMERCLERLDEFSRQVLGRVVLQEYEHEEAARLLGCTRMTVHRRLLEALDQLSDILREVELLHDISATEKKSCQEGEEDGFFLSDCDQRK